MPTAMQRHLAAIGRGQVHKTNVIGLRKAANHVSRLALGYSGNHSNATQREVDAALKALADREPVVCGELHETGVKVLTNKRYVKRFNAEQKAVIASLREFRLVGFDWTDSTHCTPVYRVCGESGSFLFRNVPWQTAAYVGGESGPVVVREIGA